MDQHQGDLLDVRGNALLHVHISMRINGNKWKGVIESASGVPADKRPEQGGYFRLRLADGREKTIHLGAVTLRHSQHGDTFSATFDTSTPPPPAAPQATAQ